MVGPPAMMQPMDVFNTIAPVFLVIALGVILRRIGFFSADLTRGIIRVAYWVGMPALLFLKISGATRVDGASLQVLAVVMIATAVAMVVAFLSGLIFRIPGVQIAAITHVSMRGNQIFIGLAVIFYAFSNANNGSYLAKVETVAVVALAPIVVVYNVLGVIILLAGQHKLSMSAVRKVLLGIVTNPLIISCTAGICVMLAGWKLPLAAGRTLGVAGQVALPLALLGIGGTLAGTKIRGHLGYSTLAALIKTAVCPVVGFAAIHMLGLTGPEAGVEMILCSTPTAISSFILADQLTDDSTLTAGGVVLSTLFSIVSLSIAVSYAVRMI